MNVLDPRLALKDKEELIHELLRQKERTNDYLEEITLLKTEVGRLRKELPPVQNQKLGERSYAWMTQKDAQNLQPKDNETLKEALKKITKEYQTLAEDARFLKA